MKYGFFASMSEEVQFEYTVQPSVVTLTAWGAEKLGLPEIIRDPLHDEKSMGRLGQENWRGLSGSLRATTPGHPVITYDCILNMDGEQRWTRIVARATWSSDEPPRYTGAIGKVMDIHDSRMMMDNLKRMATHDAMTGLLNHATAKKRIEDRLAERPEGNFALAIIDLDHFKQANDTYGHMFGDEVLIHLADKLRQCIRGGDIAARVGGDEFLILLECKREVEPAIQRIFASLEGQYKDFPISISMGVATTQGQGTDYDTLFQAADQALYTVKRSGRGHYRFYNNSMKGTLSVISPIDGGRPGEN